MDNNNFNYDSDPADCNIASSNNPSEFNTESAEEFPQTPAEFATDTESAVDSETSDTESATDNSDATDFFNSPGIIAPLGTAENTESAAENDISELYESQDSNTEAGSDNGCGCGCGDDGCDIGGGNSGSDCGYGQDCEYSEEFGESNASPEDETAATVDELYSTTAEARENCRLDDYEIISDVLGSEKQLVKQYSTALCESAEESLRDIIRDNLIECAKDQYSTYEYMEKRGLYPTEEAPENKICEAKSQFKPLCEDCE